MKTNLTAPILFVTFVLTMETTALEREFNYFLEHQEELVKKYNGRYLVIVEEEVKGDFLTLKNAYEFAIKQFQLGTFLLQKCTPGEEAYTQTYRNRRVSFV